MPVKGFYCAVGDDAELIEKKWLAGLEKKYDSNLWLRYDLTIDYIEPSNLITEYYSARLFSPGVTIVLRNADKRREEVETFLNNVLSTPLIENSVILILGSCNGTTKLGKLIKSKFNVSEFTKEEIKPFELLDALNFKRTEKVLHFCRRLFEADYNPLALFSLLTNHFLLLKKLKKVQHLKLDEIASSLGQHRFRTQKALPACKYWSEQDIDRAISGLASLDRLIRTWRYDEKMLIEMYLIEACL